MANSDIILQQENQATRLSESIIFQKTKEYYCNKGAKAWADGVTPSFITSNCMMAKTYAKLIFSYIEDYTSNNPQGIIDQKNPIYIIELCAGHGKFGFYVTKFLQEIITTNGYQDIIFKYILTDGAKDNITSWKEHPKLKPFIEQDNIDVAIFDVEKDYKIKLEKSGEYLSPGSINTPVILIANYAFDTLSTDAFQIKNSKLYETTVKVSSQEQDNWFENMHCEFADIQTNSKTYYEVPLFNKILDNYIEYFSSAAIMMPIGGLNAIQTVQSFTNQDLLFLIADKGYGNKKYFAGPTEPHIAKHDSISFMTNFDAINLFFEGQGGFSSITNGATSHFHIGAFTLGKLPSYLKFKYTCKENLDNCNPIDLYTMQEFKTDSSLTENIERLISLIRICSYEPSVFFYVGEYLLNLSDNLTIHQHQALVKTIHRVWDNYYVLETYEDVAIVAAKILYKLEEWDYARKLFEFSSNYFPHNKEETESYLVFFK